MRWIWFFLVVAGTPYARAADSIISGTIVVVALSRDYVIFAADSRVGASNGNVVSRVDDTYCKIAPLHDNTVFAAAGIVTDPIRSWSADTEMDRVLIGMPQTGHMESDEGAAALSQWAGLMIQRLSLAPRDQLLAYTKANDGVAAAGVLAGIDREGAAWVHASRIGSDATGRLSHQESDVTLQGGATRYFGLGQSEIAVEFDHGNTPRAEAERERWKSMNLAGMDFDRFKARRLVELTILYLPDQRDVGGPVDELALDAMGHHWIEVKPKCAPELLPVPGRKTP